MPLLPINARAASYAPGSATRLVSPPPTAPHMLGSRCVHQHSSPAATSRSDIGQSRQVRTARTWATRTHTRAQASGRARRRAGVHPPHTHMLGDSAPPSTSRPSNVLLQKRDCTACTDAAERWHAVKAFPATRWHNLAPLFSSLHAHRPTSVADKHGTERKRLERAYRLEARPGTPWQSCSRGAPLLT